MSDGSDQNYWERQIETAKRIEKIDTNVDWLVCETIKQNDKLDKYGERLDKHGERLINVEKDLIRIVERKNQIWEIVKKAFGLIGIKI